MKDIDETLLLHKQITVTTYGTRTSESFSGQMWSKRLFLSNNGNWVDLQSFRWWKIEGKPLQNIGSSGMHVHTTVHIITNRCMMYGREQASVSLVNWDPLPCMIAMYIHCFFQGGG